MVRRGSVAVRIYKGRNKGRPRFTISHFENGNRILKMLADFDSAPADARSKALLLSKG